MEAVLKIARPASYADYLAVESVSAHRHELIDGVIVAMAGGSDEHNALSSRVAVLISLRLPRGCRHFSPDQRFWIAAHGRSRYADGSVICGKPEHPPHDAQATTNPKVIVEVLSPSSVGDDEGEKRRDFQTMPSLQAYVLVAQDQRRVRVFRRGDDGSWPTVPSTHEQGDEVELPGLTRRFTVDDVYQDIIDEHGRSLLT